MRTHIAAESAPPRSIPQNDIVHCRKTLAPSVHLVCMMVSEAFYHSMYTLFNVVASLACCSSEGSSISRGSGSPMTLSFIFVHHPDPSCCAGTAAGTASGSGVLFQKLMLLPV